MKHFRGESRLFTRLCSIARHKIVDYFRKEKNHRAFLFSQMSSIEVDRLYDANPLPHEVFHNQIERIKVLKALESLREVYRKALTLRYGQGCGVKETAQILGNEV